jgi:GNAT superfamily N-acetyltransferase
LQRVYRAASLSNAGDAPALLDRPELLVFADDGVVEGRTRVAVAGPHANGRVVGFVTLCAGADGPELEDLFVDPGWRRRGVGRRLVSDVVEAVRQTGDRYLWVTGNPHAMDFYLAVGFVETGRVATELGPPGIRMHLDLSR